ncbi:DUF3140 domain-containing protein [Marinactinospora thermotolerans]|uniref:DUF3140 domain-containing protein n=1 Tax=Marinactinospora thermotolerans TaxID=531310 RepID=UPI001F328BE0|nr:DUF3140 domain-containing protein [Marinactinospora thermotolerans]
MSTLGRGEPTLAEQDHKSLRDEFDEAVNMTVAELENWLKSEESQEVGDTKGHEESTGHHSGREIVRIKRTRVDDLNDADYRHMRKVIGYVHRHLAQRPKGDVHNTPWRYSLMNWGHDPLKR